MEGISGGLQCKLLFKPGPTRAGCSEPCPIWVCICPRTEVPQPLSALILVLDNPHNKHFFPWIYSEFPICPSPLVLPLCTLRRIWLHLLYTLPISSCRPAVRSLLRAEDTQSPQPFLLHGTPQLPTPTALLDVFQHVNAFLILQSPRVDAGLWFHKGQTEERLPSP